MLILFFFFFFKQKTAYEMRISDWSSDVCSSDLVVVAMLDEPKGTKETYGFATAGWNAAPIVSKVVSRIGPILGVVPDENKDADWQPLMQYVLQEKKGG